ncbi:MAG: hypothetical protein ACO1N0_21645 [Fluviicola sp.]|jgi:hypothetical protein
MRLIFTLLPLLCLVACTITKRHFGPGYHVEWKKSVSKTENEIDKLNTTDSEYSVILEKEKVIAEVVIPTDSAKPNEAISQDNPEIQSEEKINVSEAQLERQNNSIIKSEPISNDEELREEQKRRVEPFTWPALGGLLLGLLLVLISFLATSPELILSIAMFIGIGVVVCSIISVAHIRKNPERYKGKGLTWTLFGLSTVGIGAVLFTLVYLLLLVTNNATLL